MTLYLAAPGAILLMASAGGLFPMPIAPVYAASKVSAPLPTLLPCMQAQAPLADLQKGRHWLLCECLLV
jgi:hypothetical protein